MSHAAQIDSDPRLKPALMVSLAIHGGLALTMVVSTLISGRGANWGDNGNGVTVGLVSNVPAIPMPKPDVTSENRVVDETKGLYKEEPKPKEVIPPKAEPIPAFLQDKPKLVPSKPSRVLPNDTTPPPNAIPFGNGGSPEIPTSNFAVNGKTQGGINMSGPAGGDFGAKYGWFVDAVRNRVSSNWVQSMVDPSVSFAPRAVLTFQILRDGSITNIQVMKSSGNESVDNSAKRAILASSPVLRLPNDYSGNVVNVEFWFDFHR
jgi:periplasmic protein TonB